MSENGAKTELKAIFCDVFPEYEGDRVATSIKVGDGVHKIEYNIPVVTSDEDAGKYFNVTLRDVLVKGVRGIAYGVSNVQEMLLSRATSGDAVDDQEFINVIAAKIKEALFTTPRASGGKAKENKEKINAADELMRMFGVSSVEELKAKAAEMAKKRK